ncbi:MAG: hypothetical protein CMG04_00605 [Candidatus Marinimicrobia bacterium]|nr:hypothetical protein [Candidatus Neomarinimicrobiota bacterium]
MVETEYQSGSPVGTGWSYYTPYFGATPSTSITPVSPYVNWTTWAYINNSNEPFIASMYSIEDDSYYDFFVTGWTQGDGDGGATWPGSQDGNGTGNGGGFSYYRSGPIDYSANIINITDVPNDQGGRVYINFKRSMVDVISHPHGVDIYTIQRIGGPNEWVNIGSIGATGEQMYTYEASTLADSSVNGDGLTAFRIITQSFYPDLVEESISVIGYSVDNIDPGIPQGLSLQWISNGIQLNWSQSQDNDFQYFIVQRSTDESFQFIENFYTADVYYDDLSVNSGQEYFYRLATVDYNGNISEYCDYISSNTMDAKISLLPEVYKLHQNYPNPFNPTTRIFYDTPEEESVTISVYNSVGILINTLVNREHSAGHHFVSWNGMNEKNQLVPAGLYIYKIYSKSFSATKKMLLLK